MILFLSIVQAMLGALTLVFNKRLLENRTVGNEWQTFFGKSFQFVVLLIVAFLGFIDFTVSPEDISPKNILLFGLSISMVYATYPLRRAAYMHEKISTLQPFTLMKQVFAPILAFALLTTEQVSIATFLVSVSAGIFLFVMHLEGGRVVINRYSAYILLASLIQAGQVFLLVYFIKLTNAGTFYLIESCVLCLLGLILACIFRKMRELQGVTAGYLWFYFRLSVAGTIGALIIMYFYGSLGIVLTSLISFLYLAFVYLFGYLFLNDRPTQKDIIMAFVISCLVFAGVLLKS